MIDQKIQSVTADLQTRPSDGRLTLLMKPDKTARISNREAGAMSLLKRLFRETFRGHVEKYIAAVLSMAVMAGSTAGLAWLMQHAINDVFVDRNTYAMWVIAASIVALAVTKGLADYLQTVLMAKISNNVSLLLQQRMFDKLLSLKLGFFNRNHSSHSIMQITTATRAASGALTVVVTTFGRDLLTLLALGTVMFIQDPVLSIGALLLGPPVVFGVYKLVRKIKDISRSELKGISEIISLTQETFLGIRAVKSFTAEKAMKANFGEAARSLQHLMNEIAKVKAATSPLMETLGGIVIAAMVVYAGWQTISLGKTPGEFMSFVTAFLLAYEPAKRLANMRVALQQSLVAVAGMYDFLDQNEPEIDGSDAAELVNVKGSIRFADVNFGYNEDKQILRDVSIELNPGEIVALVGQSGSGKSTIFALMERFYDPWSGSVQIDGKDLQSLTLASVRGHISAVGQSTALFSGTVRDNIRMGRSDATDLEIEAAADAAQATEFIMSLPAGFDTPLGERGVNLSGGQIQRLAIARAVLKNAPILLLDEATSALDTETERQVRVALSRLMHGRTTFVIAHRLSTIMEADRIYLIDDGRVADSGRHSELLKRSPLYRRLFGEIEVLEQAAS